MNTMNKQQAKILFDKLDVRRTGNITVEDYIRVLKDYADVEKIKQRIAKVDTDGDGQISFEEFYTSIQQLEEPQEESFFRKDGSIKWFDIFRHYDLDGSGYLEKEELSYFFVKNGSMTEEELTALIEDMDVIEKDGKISFAEMMLYHLKKDSE
jgi:calmodulin